MNNVSKSTQYLVWLMLFGFYLFGGGDFLCSFFFLFSFFRTNIVLMNTLITGNISVKLQIVKTSTSKC